MHAYVAALVLSGLLAAGGAGLALYDGHAQHEDAQVHDATHAPARAGSRAGHGHGGGAHPWEGGTGKVPTLADALTKLERRRQIVIDGDDGFNPTNGVRSGSGTWDDPFVVSGWFVDLVYVRDTTKAFVLKENYVADILVLDWTGQGGYVHHNHVDNLRTNRNVERTGDPTAAVIENNVILRVEELRHFDGELRRNVIGGDDPLSLLRGDVVLNIAGLNGAGIHDNVIHGGVDMKLHGHHHSDAPGLHSHNHGQADEAQAEDHLEDHQVRHIDFRFYNNRIRDDGFGLRYNDLNHAGDDRQATSEQEPDLEKPHVHHTRIAIEDNVIDGATLRVAVVNAQDERHEPGESAELVLRGNRILKPFAGDGVVVQDVSNARVLVEGNVVERRDLQPGATSAVALLRFRNSTVEVVDNRFGDYRYGVRAQEFDAATNWTVERNAAPGVAYPAYWDESVANPPRGSAEGHEGHAHDHGGDAAADAVAPAEGRRLLPVRVAST